jgi:phage-related protein (TIGR01555 family)
MKNYLKNLFKRNDGWVNNYTGLGSNSSRTNNTLFKAGARLDRYTLAELYRTNGLAKRIVNSVVDDAMRGFVYAEEELIKELKRVKAKQAIFDAASFGRLYGGAIVIALLDDGMSLEQPLDTKRVNKLISLRVFDRHQVSWTNDDLCDDFYKEWYGEPEIFTITNNQNALTGDDLFFKIHRSRCHIFGGERVCNSARSANRSWDDPILQSCYDTLKNYGIIASSSVEIVHDFVQVIMKMNGLMDKVTSGQEEKIQRRLDIIDRTRSTQNTILLDGEGDEDYEKRASSVSGLSDLWDRFSEAVCSSTGIPATRLFGRSPAGMNSTGKSDMKNWYDIVSTYREDQLEPCITWLLEMVENQQSWKNKPDNFDWHFPALEDPSEIEFADIKKKYAEIDMMYVDRGAISASEAWQERFGSGEFKYNIQLDAIDNDIEGLTEDDTNFLEENNKQEKDTNVNNSRTAREKREL